MLPYRVERIELRAEKTGRVQCQLLAAGGRPVAGPHVLRLEVSDPRGRAVEHYAQNVVAPSGKAAAVIPFALSDPPGHWTITVRDVATGTKGSTSIER